VGFRLKIDFDKQLIFGVNRRKMKDNNSQKFFGIVISKELLANRELSLADKVVYSYVASFKNFCVESNHNIADKIGVSTSTVAHSISKLEGAGFIFVEKMNGNNSARRLYAVADKPNRLAYLKQKKRKMACGKPVENFEPIVQNLHEVVQNLHYSQQGGVVQNLHTKNKRIKKNKGKSDDFRGATSPPKAVKEAFGGRLVKDHDDPEFERKFYERNTIRLMGASS
jgi:DNA-binding Lrp family transcriptional regulator